MVSGAARAADGPATPNRPEEGCVHLPSRRASTREGRVQEVILTNLEAAAESLGGRIFDRLDATFARAAAGFDLARHLSKLRQIRRQHTVPDIATLKKAGEALVNEDKHLRTKVDQAAAEGRFRADRLEAINPVIVDGFLDAIAGRRLGR